MLENVVVESRGRTILKSRYNQALVVVAAGLPLFAHAEVDMTAATAVLVSATAAVGALGAAKVAPAALTWVWSLVTGMAKRG